MPTYAYPSAQQLSTIEQSLMPDLVAEDPIFDILPIDTQDASLLKWQQLDDYYGMQQLRGLNGAPPSVARLGINEFQMKPGTYGEFQAIDEQEMTERAKFGSLTDVIDIGDLVAQAQEHLLHRRMTRIKLIGWTLLTTGTFSVANLNGGTTHTDTYTLQTQSGAVAWATAANATPLADFRTCQLLSLGYSVDFGSKATAYMNRVTWNNMIKNTNAADLYGRRTAGLGTYENVNDVNKLLAGDDLPQIVIYDKAYKNASGTITRYIPNNVVVIVGVRPGGRNIGNYTMTRNMNNANGGPGPYTKVIDNGDRAVPREIQVHDGHNGGPRLYFPSSVIILSTS